MEKWGGVKIRKTGMVEILRVNDINGHCSFQKHSFKKRKKRI